MTTIATLLLLFSLIFSRPFESINEDPVTIYVSSKNEQAVETEDCGAEDKPCKTLAAATKSTLYQQDSDIVINFAAEDHDAETGSATISKITQIQPPQGSADNPVLLVKRLEDLENVTPIIAIQTAEQPVTFSITSTTFKLISLESAPLNNPLVRVEQNTVLNLNNVKVEFSAAPEGETVVPMVQPVICCAGTVQIAQSGFSDIQLEKVPLIHTVEGMKSVVISKKSTFSKIKRSEGNGAVLEIALPTQCSLAISEAEFSECGTLNGYGGALSVDVQEGGSFTLGVPQESNDLPELTTFTGCSSEKKEDPDARSNDATSLGGGLYLSVSGQPAENGFAVKNIHFDSCKATTGSQVYITSKLEDFVASPKHYVDLIHDSGSVKGAFSIHNENDDSTEDVFALIPEVFHVKTEGTDGEECGKEGSECKTLGGAVKSMSGAALSISMAGETFPAETDMVTIQYTVKISGEENHIQNVESVGEKKAVFYVTGRATPSFDTMNFLITSKPANDAPLAAPVFCSDSTGKLTLTDIKLYGTEESITAPLSSSVISAAGSQLALDKVVFQQLTLNGSPLLQICTKTDCFAMTSVQFEQITRKDHGGAVFEIKFEDNTAFTISGASFKQCKCDAEEALGGAIFLDLNAADQVTFGDGVTFEECDAKYGKNVFVHTPDAKATAQKWSPAILKPESAPEEVQGREKEDATIISLVDYLHDYSTAYVDSSKTTQDPDCGETVDTACPSMSLALKAHQSQANTLLINCDPLAAETEAIVVERTITIRSNTEDGQRYRITFKDFETERDALITINQKTEPTESNPDQVLLIIQKVAFYLDSPDTNPLSHHVLMATGSSAIKISNSEFVLAPVTVQGARSIIESSVINTAGGELEFNDVTFTGLRLMNAPLLHIGCEQKSFGVTSSATFDDIHRQVGNGAIFSLEVAENKYVNIQSCYFHGCSAPSGKGGAVFINVTGAVPDTQFTIKNNQFVGCTAKEAQALYVYSTVADMTTASYWTGINQDIYGEIHGELILCDASGESPKNYEILDLLERVWISNAEGSDTSTECGNENKKCASIKFGLDSEKYSNGVKRLALDPTTYAAEADTLQIKADGHATLIGDGEDYTKTILTVTHLPEDKPTFDVAEKGLFTVTQLTFSIKADPEETELSVVAIHGNVNAQIHLLTVAFNRMENDVPVLQKSLISSAGRLEMVDVMFSDLQLAKVPLITLEQTATFTSVVGKSHFDKIVRAEGNGAVFETTVDNKQTMILTGADFSECKTSHGNGGALYVELKEGGIFMIGDYPDMAFEAGTTTFKQCEAAVPTVRGTQTANDDALGGAVYLKVSGKQDATTFAMMNLNFEGCKSGKGENLYVSTDADTVANHTTFWAQIIRNNEKKDNQFVIFDETIAKDVQLYELTLDVFHVSTGGKTGTECGAESDPCASIGLAVTSRDSTAQHIQVGAGTYEAENKDVVIVYNLDITGVPTETVEVVQNIASIGNRRSLFYIGGEAEVTLSKMTFAIKSTDAQLMEMPALRAASKNKVTLKDMKFIASTEEAMAPANKSIVSAERGNLVMEGVTFANLVMKDNPVISIPTDSSHLFKTTNVVFENITRTEGDGAVISVDMNNGNVLHLENIQFKNNKVLASGAVGGSIYIHVHVQPAEGAFSLKDLNFSGGDPNTHGYFVFVDCEAVGWADDKDRWTGLLGNNEVKENAFVYRDSTGKEHSMDEKNNPEPPGNTPEKPKSNITTYLFIGLGSVVVLGIVAILVFCFCAHPCSASHQQKKDISTYHTFGDD